MNWIQALDTVSDAEARTRWSVRTARSRWCRVIVRFSTNMQSRLRCFVSSQLVAKGVSDRPADILPRLLVGGGVLPNIVHNYSVGRTWGAVKAAYGTT